MNELGCTSGIGWPVTLKLFESEGNVYFDCKAVFDLVGIEKHIKQHGYKFIDKFLLDNGIQNSFIYSKNQRSRELISYSAVIMLVVRYQGKENKADELRNFLLKPLLLPPALLQQSSGTCTSAPTALLSTHNGSPSTSSSQPPTPVMPSTLARSTSALSSTTNESPSTLACQPPAVARNLSALSSTANELPLTPSSQPIAPAMNPTAVSTSHESPSTPACQPLAVARKLSTVLSSDCNALPSALAGGPLPATRHKSTKELVDLQLLIRSQQKRGRRFASRSLAQRVKKQNEQFKQMAQGTHHGGKEDLLAGIAHSVSHSTTKRDKSGNDWDGQLTVLDILELTKLIHDHKAGKSIYETLTVDKASQIHEIEISPKRKKPSGIQGRAPSI